MRVKLNTIIPIGTVVGLLVCWMMLGSNGKANSEQFENYDSALATSINGFSLQLYHEVVADNPESNVFMSPTSISIALAMLHLGARGNTQDQIASTLNVKHFEDKVDHVYKGLIKAVKRETDDFTLTTANRLYPDASFPINPDFLTKCIQYYETTVDTVDFVHHGETARQTINKWVEGETHKKICDLIGPGVIDDSTKMILVNAIYFKGNWADKFDPEMTRAETFFLSPHKTVTVDMMHKTVGNVKYMQERNCKVLMMPFKGGQLSMVFVLPNLKDGLPVLEQQMTAAKLERMLEATKPTTVGVAIPKFKLEVGFELSKVLKKLGMHDVFDYRKANLSGLSLVPHLYVSHVIHKAFVKVNEGGAEAAAVTSVVIRAESAAMPPSLNFVADHPFMFILRDNRSGTHLFIGRLMEPTGTGNENDELQSSLTDLVSSRSAAEASLN